MSIPLGRFQAEFDPDEHLAEAMFYERDCQGQTSPLSLAWISAPYVTRSATTFVITHHLLTSRVRVDRGVKATESKLGKVRQSSRRWQR